MLRKACLVICKMVNGCYSIPILTIISVGMFTSRVPPIAAKVALIFGVVTYFISQFVYTVDLHYLHVMAILFVLSTGLMLVLELFIQWKSLMFKLTLNRLISHHGLMLKGRCYNSLVCGRYIFTIFLIKYPLNREVFLCLILFRLHD